MCVAYNYFRECIKPTTFGHYTCVFYIFEKVALCAVHTLWLKKRHPNPTDWYASTLLRWMYLIGMWSSIRYCQVHVHMKFIQKLAHTGEILCIFFKIFMVQLPNTPPLVAVPLKIYGYMARRLHGYMAVWHYGQVATRLHGYMAMWLQSYVAMWLRSYVATCFGSWN